MLINKKSAMKNILIILPFFLLQVLKGDENSFSFAGYTSFSYISRLSDQTLIDIPYRMGSLNFEKQLENVSFNGNITVEYHVRDDASFVETSDPQDFILDMRELYLTYSKNNYEVRVGKQIHSWGNVDENSPLDNASALDYYYMFFSGTERKLATLSGSLDYYLKNLKISTVFSPLHSTNRIPLGKDDFPVELPIYPESHEIYQVESSPYEGGIYVNYSGSFGDLSFSSFSGYDRIFNFSGVNEYYYSSVGLFKPSPDLVFGYRKTNILGLGATILNKYFTLRFDIANFKTEDKNKSIRRPDPSTNSIYDSLAFSYPLQEKATYQQYTLQIETELPFDFNLTMQYFKHHLKEYNAVDTLPDVDVDIPGFEYDPSTMKPEDLFIPGMGVPIAILTNNALLMTLKKTFLDEQLTFNFTSMMDIATYIGVDGIAGSLNELKIEYSINQDLNILLGLTNIIGSGKKKDGTHIHPDGEDYQFNKMENFSHNRFELKYYF